MIIVGISHLSLGDINYTYTICSDLELISLCLASFSGSPERELYTRGEPGIYLRKHDVIEIGLKQKGNILRFIQPTVRSTLGVYDIEPPITRYM